MILIRISIRRRRIAKSNGNITAQKHETTQQYNVTSLKIKIKQADM